MKKLIFLALIITAAWLVYKGAITINTQKSREALKEGAEKIKQGGGKAAEFLSKTNN